jgi:hypothetical protein
MVGMSFGWEGDRACWEMSLGAVAKRLGITKSMVQRLLNERIPASVARCPGMRRKDLNYPARAYAEALERGLLKDRK